MINMMIGQQPQCYEDDKYDYGEIWYDVKDFATNEVDLDGTIIRVPMTEIVIVLRDAIKRGLKLEDLFLYVQETTQ